MRGQVVSMSEMMVSFPAGKRVDVHAGEWTIRTDQTCEHGGAGSAPEPFTLFLASLAACAGIYVLGFCQARSISTEGLAIRQTSSFDGQRLSSVRLEIVLPPGFPAKYIDAVRAAANGCKVKKVLASPPDFAIEVSARQAA
jgi:ribosomal protein S12 methylthiotransferase accessory factor